MAAAPDPEEILRSTSGKENFQRITRLLICGGTSLLREIFDLKCPPSNLPTILSNPATEKKIKAAYLTMPQRRCLSPSPAVYGKSVDFDITLLVRLLRTICNLTPPSTGWDALPLSADQSLTADIARIKCYRNSVYGHVNQGMAIRDNEFKTLWQEISEALVRIAGQISSTRKTAWQGAIAKYLTDPLTTEDERNVQELKAWYKNDMEIKKSIDEASERISRLEKAVHEGTDLMEATVCQETKEIKDHLKEMNQSIDALAFSSARALLRLKIDCEAISGPGLQQGATVMIGQPQESQGVIKEGTVASVTSSQSQVSNTTASLGGNVGNGVTPSPQQVLSSIASKYLNNLNPSTPEEFNGFIRYMKEVRKVILVDCNPGSLIITVECGSLKILEGLWKDYCTGNLGRVVQECLATEDILKELGLSEIKLITTIDEKDYKDCQKYLAGCSRENRSQPEKLMREMLSSTATPAESQSGRDVASTTEGCYDIGEPARKRRKLDTTEDQSSDLPTKSQDKPVLSTELSTGRTFVAGISTETSKGKESSLSEEKWGQPIIRSPRKQQKAASDAGFVSEIFFALDYSSSVSEEEFQKEIEFVGRMSNSWNPENDLEAVVVFGNAAETVRLKADSGTFSVNVQGLETKAGRQSKGRRIDLALREAADRFTSSANENLVVLLTAGRQLSGDESKEDDRELLVSATEALSSKNIKVILVPVGMEIDFRELGLIARRPQYLFPLDSFDHMTPEKASDIGSYIMETVDLESYAKNKVDQFSVIPKELSMWEITSLCSDVLEGAWYELYDDQKKSNKPNKIKMLIRESIDNFQSTLVTECRVVITLAVLGSLGAGKSFFLNSLLNLGLPNNFKVQNGPLPSADGDSQTPIPIYVKNGRKVQVLFHKQEVDPNPVVWFPEEKMSKETLARVNSTLLTRFQDKESFTGASYVVLQGPFPVFTDLKTRKMTRQGLHLELEVDVQFVDVPGLGDNTGNAAISGILSKADVVLFFDGGHSGRHVSEEDIAQIFRRRDGQFEFVSRPKLVHIFNDRNPLPPPLDKFGDLCQEKERKLREAWSNFRKRIRGDNGIYKEAREKLPKLNSEDVLEKLSMESESIYFHPQNSNFLTPLKNAVDEHVRSVKIKQVIHPFLQSVYWAATMLRKRVLDSLYARKKEGKLVGFDVGEVVFEMLFGLFVTEESELITSFVKKASLPLKSDKGSMHDFLYSNFLLSPETRHFLAKVLKKSLESYTSRLTAAFCNSNLSILEDVPKDLLELTTMVCITRVKQFCANFAPTYLLHFLRERKNQISLPKGEMLDWARASSDEDKSNLVRKYLHLLLYRAEMSLQDNRTRKKQASRTSHFQLMKTLEELVGKLLPASSFQDAYRTGSLESLKLKLPEVILFCKDTIREINPHPKLDVRAVLSLPEEMTNAKEDDKILSQSSPEKIFREVTRLLLNPGKKKAKDVIREMETKLKFKRGYLELQQPHNADQRLWALALVHVLSDKEHFDYPVPPEIVFDPTENETLLSLARERLFAHQKSSIFCKTVKTDDEQPIPEDEIHLKIDAPKKCLEALVSSEMHNTLDSICTKSRDPSQQLVPVFIPITRPGHTPDIQGNYFLDEDPWRKASPVQEESGEEKDGEARRDSNQGSGLELNIFLVVEPNHLEKLKSTINDLRYPPENDVKLMYVILPQKGRGIGVTKSIIKSLAECFKFSLYWTIDDNIQFMYRFVEDDCRWHKCPLTSGLLFGQRVFQSCLKKAVKDISREDRDDLFDEATQGWEKWAKQPLRDARELLLDGKPFSELQKNPNLLHSPFANISEICGGDPDKEVKLMGYEREFVATCRKKLFEDTINHISGISLAHVRSKGSDLMSRYPKADYMRSEQLSQVVLNNGYALKGKNFVSDEVILLDEELQIYDEGKCNDPYWGIKGSEESFRRALLVSGVAGYRVIRIVYKDKKLRNAFDRPSSYFTSQWFGRSQNDDVDEDVDMGD